MLGAKHRFHGYGSLRRVYSGSTNIRGNLLGLKYGPRNHNKTYRTAVVVGKKVNKSAVKRNRIRRRVYEAIRTSEFIPEATDLVFIAYSDKLAELPAADIRKLTDELLEKVNKKHN